jgi:hypothetical protein
MYDKPNGLAVTAGYVRWGWIAPKGRQCRRSSLVGNQSIAVREARHRGGTESAGKTHQGENGIHMRLLSISRIADGDKLTQAQKLDKSAICICKTRSRSVAH